MNLKRLYDSLLYNNDHWEVTIDDNPIGITGFGAKHNNISYSNGVYSLLRITPSEDKEVIDVQKAIKTQYNDFEGADKFWKILLHQFSIFLTVISSNFESDNVTIRLRYMKSSSNLVRDFISRIEDCKINNTSIHFSRSEDADFKKGDNITFDSETYFSRLIKHGKSEDEARALVTKAEQLLKKDIQKAGGSGNFKVHNSAFKGSMVQLRSFLRGVAVPSQDLIHNSTFEVIIDDFITSGVTIKDILRQLPDNSFAVALFKR